MSCSADFSETPLQFGLLGFNFIKGFNKNAL